MSNLYGFGEPAMNSNTRRESGSELNPSGIVRPTILGWKVLTSFPVACSGGSILWINPSVL